MTESNIVEGGAQNGTSPVATSTDSGADGAEHKANAHNGILTELKRERSTRRDLESKLQELERGKLEAEGKKEDLIKSLRQELTEYKTQIATSIKSKVEDQVAMRAKDLGCVDTELLLKAVDLSSVEVDSRSFKITEPEAVQAMIEHVRKNKPYLFKQAGPEVRDGLPLNRTAPQKSFNDMTREELAEFAKQKGIR